MSRPISSLILVSILTPAAFAQVDESLLAGMKARSIGPAGMSGRVVSLDAVISDPNTVYVGAASGGLWKSTSGGLTFKPIFDDQPVASIGAICIYQPSPDIVWIGTGEGNPRNSVSLGNGVYKTTDGGRTWKYLGLDKTERIRRIWVHPSNPDVAFVAALGTAWGENPERGLFKTSDGGKSWEKVLYVDAKTGCIDIEVDPRNPLKMFASMWDHRRKPWTFRSGGPGSGLHLTVDGGRTWKKLGKAEGLPAGILGRTKAAFAPSNPKIVYALVEAKKNVLLRSDDGGLKFRVVNKEDNIAPRPFYYCDIRIDPKNADRIYNLHSSITLSEDGGKSFRQLVGYGQAHPDHHTMWIDPNNPRTILEGNDGGVSISRDHGATWGFVTQLPLAQFYHIAVDMDVPYNVYGGMQDNGSWRGPSTVWENGGIRNHHWDEVCFGDGFATLPDPNDSMQGYAMSQGGSLIRFNLRTGERKSIKPIGPEDTDLRFNWNAGIAQDPFNKTTIYYGSQFVHKSTDRGDSWVAISPDLTTNHAEWQKQESSGGLTLDVTGAENYTTILTIAPSPMDTRVIWVGTDDGRVHVTKNSGADWTSVEANIPGLPVNAWCPHIEASKFDKATAFAVFDDHRRNNLKPYVYKTADSGKTWRNLATSNIRGYCLALEQDPIDEDLLFLGTEFGLWFSCDDGAHWSQFKNGFPTCSAMALVVHPREHDLVIGTHGRAAYVIDDIWPLRGLDQGILESPLHLFPIPPAIAHRTRQTGASRFPGQGEFRGEVRRRGAMITFAVHQEGLKHPDPKIEAELAKARKKRPAKKAKKEIKIANGSSAAKPNGGGSRNSKKADAKKPLATGQARIEILDKKGNLVRSFDRGVTLGLNRIVWDLSRDGGARMSRGGSSGRRRFRGGSRGGEVLPGTYTVRITIGEKIETGKVEVQPDPREIYTVADREAKDELRREGQKIMARGAKVTTRLAKIKPEIESIAAKLERMAKDERPKALDKAMKAAQKALADFDTKLWGKSGGQGIVRSRGVASKIMRGAYAVSSSWAAPTQAERTMIDRAETAVDKLVSDFNKLLSGPIKKFNEALAKTKLSFAADTKRIK